MLAGMRLLRRIGLALGAWMFFYYWLHNPGSSTMAAAGAAIFAFFIPSVPASSFGLKDDEK